MYLIFYLFPSPSISNTYTLTDIQLIHTFDILSVNLSLNVDTPFLSSHQLPVGLCPGVEFTDISADHVAMSTGFIIVQILFRQAYF